MEKSLFILVIVLQIHVVPVQGLASPCNNTFFFNVPFEELRYVYNAIDEMYEPKINDGFLRSGWYRVSSNNKMAEFPPGGMYMCGTRFPIWLNGNHPSTDTPESRTACLKARSDCFHHLDIMIANCGAYIWYYLKPTGIENAAYCFGIGVNASAPNYQPPKPNVNVTKVETDENSSLPKSETVFKCDFQTSSNEGMCNFANYPNKVLLYMVHWYMDGLPHYNTPYVDSSTNTTAHISETTFLEKGFVMGTNLSCSVTAFCVDNGRPGNRSDISDRFFAGIRILTSTLTLFEASTMNTVEGIIQIQCTVPIGCSGSNPCSLDLITYVPEKEVAGICQQLAFAESTCGVLIYSEYYDNVHNITVAANIGDQFCETDCTTQVFLKISNSSENAIWKNYQLPSIPVTILGASTTPIPTECKAFNDPHYITFDQRRFDDHVEAGVTNKVMILYKNVLFDTEVQIQYIQCGRSQDVRCICGVAVRAGPDVYVNSICGNITLGYKYCSDEGRSLTVKTINENEMKIHFTHGTYVYITRGYIRPLTGYYLTARIFPTAQDNGNTRGLCGTFNGDINDDFHYRNGSSFGSRYHSYYPSAFSSRPSAFALEWRVKNETQNLFSEDFSTSYLTKINLTLCVCENSTDGNDATSQLTATIPCQQNGVTRCSQGNLLNATNCASIGRVRRSVRKRPSIPVVRIQNDVSRHVLTRPKRQTTESTWPTVSAATYCRNQFEGNGIYNICSDVPLLNPNISVDICIVDIENTNTTGWVQSSLSDMALDCYRQLKRNVSMLRSEGNGTTLSERVHDKYCPSDCSGYGTCQNGTCVCDDGTGGSDCSVDLTVPCTLSGLLDGGLCDRNEHDCTTTSIYGGAFVESDNLTCRFQAFQLDITGSRRYLSTHYTRVTFVTYVEIECTLNAQRRKRSASVSSSSFVTGYSVSVSNNGNIYSNTEDLFIYNAACQSVIDNNGTWEFTLMDGYCFIDNQCISEGYTSPNQVCYYCNTNETVQAWSVNTTLPECEENIHTEENGKNRLLIIVGGTIGGVAFVILIVMAIRCVKKNTNRSAIVDPSVVEQPEVTRTDSPKKVFSPKSLGSQYNNVDNASPGASEFYDFPYVAREDVARKRMFSPQSLQLDYESYNTVAAQESAMYDALHGVRHELDNDNERTTLSSTSLNGDYANSDILSCSDIPPILKTDAKDPN